MAQAASGEPVRGRVLYADGTSSAFTFSRYVNGAERVVAGVEVDGDVFAPAGAPDAAAVKQMRSREALACEVRYYLAFLADRDRGPQAGELELIDEQMEALGIEIGDEWRSV